MSEDGPRTASSVVLSLFVSSMCMSPGSMDLELCRIDPLFTSIYVISYHFINGQKFLCLCIPSQYQSLSIIMVG